MTEICQIIASSKEFEGNQEQKVHVFFDEIKSKKLKRKTARQHQNEKKKTKTSTSSSEPIL